MRSGCVSRSGTTARAVQRRDANAGTGIVVPGLIDCHVHLTHSLDGDFVNRPAHETLGDAVLHGVRFAKLTLAAGFTTVRNVGSDEFADHRTGDRQRRRHLQAAEQVRQAGRQPELREHLHSRSTH